MGGISNATFVTFVVKSVENAKLKEVFDETTNQTTTLKVELGIQTNMVKVLEEQREKTAVPIPMYNCMICSQQF